MFDPEMLLLSLQILCAAAVCCAVAYAWVRLEPLWEDQRVNALDSIRPPPMRAPQQCAPMPRGQVENDVTVSARVRGRKAA